MHELETVTISKVFYEHLLSRDELLYWLESKGVDNWRNYSTPPVREDYETDEEYEKAYEKAIYGR